MVPQQKQTQPAKHCLPAARKSGGASYFQGQIPIAEKSAEVATPRLGLGRVATAVALVAGRPVQEIQSHVTPMVAPLGQLKAGSIPAASTIFTSPMIRKAGERLYALDLPKSRPAPVMELNQGRGRKDIEIPRRVVPLF